MPLQLLKRTLTRANVTRYLQYYVAFVHSARVARCQCEIYPENIGNDNLNNYSSCCCFCCRCCCCCCCFCCCSPSSLSPSCLLLLLELLFFTITFLFFYQNFRHLSSWVFQLPQLFWVESSSSAIALPLLYIATTSTTHDTVITLIWHSL